MVAPWPHQLRGVAGVHAAIDRGVHRICLTSPTGGGKTWMICELARWYLDRAQLVSVYTNRRLLIDQLERSMQAAGLYAGIRAANRTAELEEPLQISSVQTEHARCMKRDRWELHKASLVVIDEAHLFTNKMAVEIIDKHIELGAVVVGVTATPLDLGGIYDELVIAGTNSDLRACGAIVPALMYGPDEPDLRHIGKVNLGEDLTEKQNVKAIMTHGVFGRVFDNWKRLNPTGAPTILFAPGVPESVWFAEQFHAQGVPSAHIDGEEVWVNGALKRSEPGIRAHILEKSKAGELRVLCNRFVLREGIDCPWLKHGILATVFGSLQSYLQSGGRLLRASTGKQTVTIQDHGGNWHRHGSLNADWNWELGDTSRGVSGGREERLRAAPGDGGNGAPREPIRCPQCHLILASWICKCGFVIDHRKKSRPVIQADGTLIEMRGNIFVPRKTCMKADTAKLWSKAFFAARNSKTGQTFAQALGYFCYQHGYYPPPDLRGMPKDPGDLCRAVKDVPNDRLY